MPTPASPPPAQLERPPVTLGMRHERPNKRFTPSIRGYVYIALENPPYNWVVEVPYLRKLPKRKYKVIDLTVD